MSRRQTDFLAELASAGLAHDLDPKGDIVLILNSGVPIRNLPFKRAENKDHRTGSARNTSATINPDALAEETAGRNQSDISENALKGIIEPVDGGFVAAMPLVHTYGVGGNTGAVDADDGNNNSLMRVRASSKHLMLASRVFDRMLQVSFKEGHQLSSQGYTEVPLPDDDSFDLLILLDLIHGQTRDVPRTVDLRTFTGLATLVDKYELLEATDIVADHWFQGLRGDVLTNLNKDTLAWLWLSWVFKKPGIFRKATKVTVSESHGLLVVNHLPIPQIVLEKIDRHREDVLTRIFKYLQDTVERYQGNDQLCSLGIQCDGMVLGSLIKRLKKLRIWPLPQPPYNGISVQDLLGSLAKIEVPQYCTNDRIHWEYPCVGVEKPLRAMTQKLSQTLQGLELRDVVSIA